MNALLVIIIIIAIALLLTGGLVQSLQFLLKIVRSRDRRPSEPPSRTQHLQGISDHLSELGRSLSVDLTTF